jgi:RNA polymerase sigma-70 factor, ECF subfamily
MLGRDATMSDAKARQDRTMRFQEATLPLLDDAYWLARFLTRNPEDAEEAVQECYLRALRIFDSCRGPAVKPWLLTILRNVCYSHFARGCKHGLPADFSDCELSAEQPLWQAPLPTPESTLQRQQDGAAIRRLVEALPAPFREAIVLREFNDLSYREIAVVVGVPVGTVMSRLARARAMLRAAWNATEPAPQSQRGHLALEFASRRVSGPVLSGP